MAGQNKNRYRNDSSRKRRYTDGSDSYQKKRRFETVFDSFLLGGNRYDPLNLKSIAESDSPKVTPQASPSNVILPANPKDPLNLTGSESADESNPTSERQSFHKRNKRRRTSSETELMHRDHNGKNYQNRTFDDNFLNRRNIPHSSKPRGCEHKVMNNPPRFNNRNNDHSRSETFKNGSKGTRFQYGNYNRYYGYRNPVDRDSRLQLFSKEFFENKDVLDIGCNVGHVTIAIAREFGPKKIVGIDIDSTLITVANRNIRNYITESIVRENSFPSSMPLLFGPILAHPDQPEDSQDFPNNIAFVSVNYVPESDNCLVSQTEEYDCILCLSLTKWIHLNWGDAGVKRLFKRIFLHLRPGGRLILEPQCWQSYHKKAKITVSILVYSYLRFSKVFVV